MPPEAGYGKYNNASFFDARPVTHLHIADSSVVRNVYNVQRLNPETKLN